MYVEVSVSYRRRLGYFLMMRGVAMGIFPVDAALHQFGDVQERRANRSVLFKYFILLHFGISLRCGCNALVQCTKIFLTPGVALPRIEIVAAHKPDSRGFLWLPSQTRFPESPPPPWTPRRAL